MIRLTRRYHFAASHRLHNPSLSEPENRAVYGKCSHPFGHGHNYVLGVTVRGPIDERSGRVVDPRLLDQLVGEEVLRACDHKNLNVEVPEFAGGRLVPTSECLAQVIQARLLARWAEFMREGRPALERIQLEETGNNSFTLPVSGT